MSFLPSLPSWSAPETQRGIRVLVSMAIGGAVGWLTWWGLAGTRWRMVAAPAAGLASAWLAHRAFSGSRQ